jgi:hypothetical protein
MYLYLYTCCGTPLLCTSALHSRSLSTTVASRSTNTSSTRTRRDAADVLHTLHSFQSVDKYKYGTLVPVQVKPEHSIIFSLRTDIDRIKNLVDQVQFQF